MDGTQTKDKKPETRDERIARHLLDVVSEREARAERLQNSADENEARRRAYDEQQRQTYSEDQTKRGDVFDRFALECLSLGDTDDHWVMAHACWTTYRAWLLSEGVEIALSDTTQAIQTSDEFDSAMQDRLPIEPLADMHQHGGTMPQIILPGNSGPRWKGVGIIKGLKLDPPEPEASASLVVHGTGA